MTDFNGANTGGNTAGTSGADLILAAGGNDSVAAGAGDDQAYGGTGNDTIQGGAGNDIVSGGTGNDVIGGGTGNDIVSGGAGDDVLSGGEGADILSGGSGKDTFQVQANSGDDIIVDFQFGFDKINFYAGAFANLTKNLTISTFADLQKMIADFTMAVQNMGQDAAKIQLDADQSITFLNVGTLFGFPADTNPNATGSSLDNLLFGSEASGGFLNGGAGDDTILAGSGSAVFRGDNDNDTLMGGMGDDTIGAHSGNDVLFGNAGDDILSGNVGNDTLTGDDGADTFRFGVGVGHDVVTDLNFAEGDYLFFVANAISAVNITVDSVTDLQIFASNADSTVVNGGNLVITYGENSVTLAEWGDLSFV
jgi:trimeric autotransporter adhesin